MLFRTILFFSALVFSNLAWAGDISFNNFSKPLSLTKQGGHYLVNGHKRQKVALSNRLIIKSKALDKEQLLNIDKAVAKVILLFSMKQASYFQLELDDESELPRVLELLKKNKKILLVQPDILQLKSKSDAKLKNSTEAFYIKQLGLNKLWQKTRGAGVKIAVIDDGFNFKHPELKQLKPTLAYDLHQQNQQATAKEKDRHGTLVAGVIFASHKTGKVRGVAPEAELIALRHLDTWTSKTLISFNVARLAEADIINASWQSQFLLEPIADVVNDLALNGRQGKGTAVVFAAGNQNKEILPLSSEAALGNAVVVGAYNRHKKKTRFSNYGASVDTSLYGKGVMSTGLEDGYSKLSGTSLSAAIASAYLALLLSQDPSLSLDELVEQLKMASQ